MTIKDTIKRLRSSQPFNRAATTGARSVLSLFGLKSEFLIKHLHRIDLVETRLPDGKTLRLESKGDDWVSNQIFWRGWDGYEPETIPLFYRLARQSKVTFDVGAYVGFFSLIAAHANKAGRVFAFEPMPAIFRRLERNISINNINNTEIILGAVGAEEGEAEFFHLEGLELPTSSSLSYDFIKDNDNLTSTKVKVFQLDKFAGEKGVDRVDLMKIDTESTEPEVLRGAASLLQKSRPHMIIEVLKDRGSETALQEILRPLGYKFYLLTPDGAIEKEFLAGHPDFLNYLFTTLKADEVKALYQ